MLLIFALMAGLAALYFHEQTELADSYPLSDANLSYYNRVKWQCFGVFLALGVMHLLKP